MDIKENKTPKPPKKPTMILYGIILLVLVAMNFFVLPSLAERSVKETSYDVFISDLEKGKVTEVSLGEGIIYFSEKKEGKGDKVQIFKTGYVKDEKLIERLDDAGVKYGSELPEKVNPLVNFLFTWILPFVLIWTLGGWLMRRMMKNMGGAGGPGAMAFGKSNAKIYVKSATGIKFSDVAGEDEAKELLSEIVDYLHYPDKYTEIGASMPKGALLVGPPGTGKTLLAKAVAGEANVPFFSISGSEFVEMFVGMGAAKVRDLFKQANEKAPCIVFIDEIDTIGKKRDGANMGGNDEREQTLNQLLTEMDGFDGSKGVVILAATNRPDSLDPALLRPGRFDRRIPVELPDLKGREEILKVHARKIKISDNVDFHEIAKAASGASGAELANIVNEAALRAVRDRRRFATQADMEESIEVVIAGYQKKSRVLSEKEKLIVSYHEVGHALVAALQTNSAPVHKITIIPRTSGALGYTMQVDEGEHFLMSKEELENKIATFTGGRAAEELIFHSVTTGASNDIEQATKIARGMISRFGMSDEFDMVAMESMSNQYLGGDSALSCSFETQTLIDKKVIELVKKQHDKAYKILEDNIAKLHELAKFLYENETITGEEFMRILNTKPRIGMNEEAEQTGKKEETRE
ncbi:MAG: ATP-dependent zinc metalloprotease FtsH [Blautia sp.]|uniref:ATP-dependent zinc metalloprotease FtsH n=1 Tax=Blautia sp. TaxID=1955243 RepID=UPI002E7784B4|nr:ATP-dependent zinc metalloprotease FtsH [Blautia sp.]MEE1444399.1 ATP-dependent zinc metalloprotease FtsH [Blautia sp.]